MDRAVAVKRLRKILGDNVGYRVDPKAPPPEEREAARVGLPAARDERKRLEEKARARFEAVLAADQEYQALKAARDEAKKREHALLGMTHHYKFTVGISNSMFFHVRAEGDSWEQIFEKLEKKKVEA